MKKSEKFLLEIKKIILEKEPTAKVFLYGSRARGNAIQQSDWDLLILLNTEVVTTAMEKSITDPLYDLEFDTGEVISPMIYSEKEWNSKYRITSFYQNITKESRRI